jgi:hypothetical protein
MTPFDARSQAARDNWKQRRDDWRRNNPVPDTDEDDE